MVLAVIFDLDGTVLDNEGDWEESFQIIAGEKNLQISPEFRTGNGWIHEPGLGLPANWKRILQSGGEMEVADAEMLSHLTVDYYLENFSSDLKVMNGLDDLILYCQEHRLATGLATGSTWSVVENELSQLQLHLAFDVTTTGEEVAAQKPNPDIYLLAAQKLGVEPDEALVIEDSLAGVRAAVEAGCKTVGLVSEYATEELLKAAGAHHIVSNLGEVVDILTDDERKSVRPDAGSDVGKGV